MKDMLRQSPCGNQPLGQSQVKENMVSLDKETEVSLLRETEVGQGQDEKMEAWGWDERQ